MCQGQEVLQRLKSSNLIKSTITFVYTLMPNHDLVAICINIRLIFINNE